jgi:DNA adenine methylase
MENKEYRSIHYSPLRYPGGKNCIFSFMSNFFYENNLIGINYAEPYAGGAGLALRLLFTGHVNHIYINDLDKSIFSFWYSIINNSVKFCDWVRNVEISIDNWRYFKEIQKNAESADTFELAKSTFFLNRTNISGVLKGGIIGGIEQHGKYKIDVRFNKEDLIKRINKIQQIKSKISLTNMDGIAFMKHLNRKKDDIFIYLDPPYYQKGADLYLNFYSEADHRKLSEYAKKLQKKWLISYDNHEFILNLYNDHNKIIYRLSQSASNRIGDEVIIVPHDLVISKSMTYLNSAMLI